MKTSLPERRIASFWQQHAAGLSGLITEEDGPVTVVFAGRPNDDHGADFRDAILATRHGLAVGDIELHTDSGGWWAHRHHLDPVYNRVILHVVYRHDCGRSAELQNGRTVPTLTLGRFLGTASGRSPYAPDIAGLLPCRAGGGLSPPVVTAILNEAGDARFRMKTDTFRHDLDTQNPTHILYQALMEALGYHRNRGPMRRLAEAIPFERLMESADSQPDGECLARWQGLLLGGAGLLPSQRRLRNAGGDDEWVRKLEKVWKETSDTAALAEEDWHFSRVRPGNYPVRRIAAMSYLLLKFRREGLLPGLTAAPECMTAGQLVQYLTVPASGYWSRYLDFGQPAAKPVPALCGAGRAADIAVNVVLPFGAAYREPDGLAPSPFLESYRAFPSLADNAVTTKMRGLLRLPAGLAKTARRQQGLLHIHHTWCAAGRCGDCPLGAENG